jgi:heat-inducible transcriptional repressor
MNEGLSPRSLSILKALVENYIRDGMPVASGVLARESRLQVSSATIRHVMSKLEQAGYLASPHTSAGRVPTTQGYRLFIDHCVTLQKPHDEQIQQWKERLSPDRFASDLVAKASSLLSEITQLTGVVTIPRSDKIYLQQIEFLPLAERQVLVVLVLNDREVQNRIINTHRSYSRRELELASQQMTHYCRSYDWQTAREKLWQELQQGKKEIDVMLQSVLSITDELYVPGADMDYIVDGELNLWNNCDEPVSVDEVRSILQLFSEKNDLLKLLDQSMQAPGVKIFVGEESGCEALDHFSLITAPYQIDGDVVGVLGVVGPCRMRYPEAVSVVDITAKLLSSAFQLNSV